MTEGTWISVKELANVMNTYPKKAIRWATKTASTRYVPGVGRGGRKLQVSLESLPRDIQQKYFASFNNDEHLPVQAPSNIIPMPERRPARKEPSAPASINKTLTPDQERTALARYDLVSYVRDVKKRAKNAGHKKTKAAGDAMDLYNNGFILGDVFEALGNVDLKTVYRWDKELRNAYGDYTALAPRYGNITRGQFSLTDMERETFLRTLLQPNRLKIGSAIRITRELLRIKGIVSDNSDSMFRRFAERYREENNHIWVLARQGEKALDDKVLPFIERDAALLKVGDILVADGHKLNFNVINPFTGKPSRAMLVLYLDWASRYPCGFEIMLTEDVQCITSAFRRAVMHLGKVPAHCLLDNGKAFRAKVFTSKVDLEQAGIYGLYARLGVDVRFSAPYNAKDKVVERFFKTFSEWIERMMPSYCGASIDDKPPYMLRNEKFHKSLHNPVAPTVEQAIQLVQKGIDFYVSQPHGGLKGKTPYEVFEKGRGSGVDVNELNHLMMSTEIKKLYRNGVRLFGGHYFNEALVGLKSRVIVKYDFQDLSKVLVYGMDGQFLGTAERTHKFDPLMRGMDYAAMKEHKKQKRQIKQNIARAVKAVHGRHEKLPIDWQEAVDAVPELPEVIEAAEASSAMENLQGDATAPAICHEDEKPIFEHPFEYYEYLMDKSELTEEDRQWIEQYRTGAIFPGDFESIYGGIQAASY